MKRDQLESIKHIVINLLKNGSDSQALGVVQGAGIMAYLIDLKMRGTHDEFMQLFEWISMAGECAIDRKFDDMQRQEWHDTQVSLEESVR